MKLIQVGSPRQGDKRLKSQVKPRLEWKVWDRIQEELGQHTIGIRKEEGMNVDKDENKFKWMEKKIHVNYQMGTSPKVIMIV